MPNQFAQLGAALDAELEAVKLRVESQATALEAVSQKVDGLTKPGPEKPGPGHPPLFEQWQADIRKFADIYAAKLLDTSLSGAERLDRCYYDAAWVYHNLAEYFQRPDYLKVRDEAIKIYRDGYVLAQPEPGKVAGWMIFPDGLYHHYQATGDELSKRALLLMADKAAYASEFEITHWLLHEYTSREAAYNLRCKLLAQQVGGTPVGIEAAKTVCLGHLAQWRAILDGSKTDLQWIEPHGVRDDCRPFMVGNTVHALITYVTRTPDPTITSAITSTLDLLWDKMYLPESKAMCYTDRTIRGVGERTPAPDVNMLIAPAYAWLGQRERADLLFEGSVLGAYLHGYKQYNQAVRWTFEYLKWRNQ